MTIAGYEAWKLAGPYEHSEAGTAEGEICNRPPEPDEDAPRNWRPKPCTGTMVDDDGVIRCERCGDPTTHSALWAYIDADERMRALGWSRTIFDLEDGDEVAVAERGSTGIFRAVWVKPYLHYQDCVSNMGKHFVKRVDDLTEDEAETMARCEADHLEYMQAQTKTMQTLQSFMERYEK